MSDDAFVEASRAAFAKWFPSLLQLIERGSGVNSSVVMVDGEPVDICVEERRIYGGDARRFAAGQVEAFMDKPLRMFMQRLDLSGLISRVGYDLVKAIDDGLRKGTFGATSGQPIGNPTFLVVFGLGLGHHLEELVRRTEARWLIVVEPLVEFIEHSFHVVDWVKLDERLESNGGGICIVPEMDPGRMISAIVDFMNRKGIPYTDGSWIFTHYPLWAFDEARNRLHEAVEFAFINRGFFEDELVMLGNTVENYATREFWLLEGRPRLRRPETAVVVGSGPSLDDSLETLRRIRDRVVLFSAGTSLRPLLRGGLVPDFHCEIENGIQVYQVLSETAKCEDLTQITLIASSTVDPRVASLFGETIFYFRDSVSSTQILGRKHREIPASGPTCVNLATNMAAAMGLTDVVLFGTDCGIRGPGRRHAGGTVYEDIATWQQRERKNYSMKVEGNFGGVVWTDLIYDVCRTMLGESISYLGLNVLNCSDGAQIAGARPCVPEALEITTPIVDRAAFRAAIEKGMQRCAPGEILEQADFSAVRQKVEQLFADFDDLLVELADGEADFSAAYQRMMKFIATANDRYGRTESIISGSLQALPRLAMFYGFRMADEEGRRRLYDFYLAEFRTIAVGMAKKVYELLDRLETLVPTSPDRALAKVG